MAICGALAAGSTSGEADSNGVSTTLPVAEVDGLPRMDDRSVLEAWGRLVAREQNIAGIEITGPEMQRFLDGFTANLRNQPAPGNLQKAYPDIEKLARARREKLVEAIQSKNEAAAHTFFEGLKRNPGIVELPGRVWCEVVQPGTGSFPNVGQTVNVHYTATLIDGTEFGQMGPIDLVLVTNREVCRGWTAALRRIGKGGRIKLYVPPPLPETTAERWGIPPGSAMIFEIELNEIKETSVRDLEDALLPPAPEPEPPPPSGYSEAQLVECWGWVVAQQARLRQYELNEAESAGLVAGLAAGIRDASPPAEWTKVRPVLEQFLVDRRTEVRAAARHKKTEAMRALFAELKKNTNVIALPSGLRYEVVRSGHGAHPRPGQIVLVDYTARLIDGTIFDQTYNEPLHIEVGSVIDGLNEGLQQAGRGARLKLYVPPWIGYGGEDHSGVVAPIPADSTLIYDLQLLDIQDASTNTASPSERSR
jgi:FKBP-type peptidyl-prolyl cis-trans isomerase